MSVSLKIKNLGVAFGGKQIFSKLNLEIQQRGIFTLLGASGCGKSTFLRCLNRLCEEMGGEVFGEIYANLDSNQMINIKEIPLEVLRKNIGMLFQSPQPFNLSIEKNLSLPLSLLTKLDKHAIEQKICESLMQVGLWDSLKNRLKENALRLSGGEQQRLLLARILSLEPKILTLDEPTSALDLRSQRVIEELLVEIGRTHTLVMISHNIDQALRIADSLAIMQTKNGTCQILEMPKNKKALEAALEQVQ
ncbi:phosphate ABC transporter ATP-binding protein [Helicobacter sp. MIT 05-5294]|uniref:phosphate ABC transporter ATP-binding protein n=1 Tax=Helicobacter sp. MIT 05-5294 TaxID=1548150 RepID=UPI00051FCE5B|nr:phosphate ABC transporter ATP-binding protein [Helicobacter sp. MIT 05-5294]TLD86309.1 phosphate ABC transporter ATP-binding protein [Helicobacter sp. MIT 05-5294]